MPCKFEYIELIGGERYYGCTKDPKEQALIATPCEYTPNNGDCYVEKDEEARRP